MEKEYYIGTSGWAHTHWKGKFYPQQLRSSGWFDYYKQKFNSVEINNTFYRWPIKKIIDEWRENAPDDFKYTLKAPGKITHVKRLKDVEGKLKHFYDLSRNLKKKNGCHLFQLPPSFKRNEMNEERLKIFLKSLNMRKCNAIEFRHRSWWHDDIYELFEKEKAIFVSVIGLGMPKKIVVSNRQAYLRFHGRSYKGRYSKQVMKEYAQDLKKLKADLIFAYFNNDESGYAAANAEELKGFIG